MATTLLNSSVILNEMLALLTTESVALRAVNRQYDDRFAASGVYGKNGTSIQVRKPIQVAIRTGKTMNTQETVEESVTVTCGTQIGVDLPAFSSENLTMHIDDFSNRYLRPCGVRLASEIDRLILAELALYSAHSVGTPGTSPATALVWSEAAQKLIESNVPVNPKDVTAIISPGTQTSMVGTATTGFVNFFNPQPEISKTFRTGQLPIYNNIQFGMDQNVGTLTMGTRTGTTLVDDAAATNATQGSTTIHVDGFGGATNTIKKGETFTVADVYAVNPQSKVQYSSLYQFTCASDFTASGSEGDITVMTPMYTTGGRKNISAFPVDGKAVTFFGTTVSTAYTQNIVLHRDAITFATADLLLPRGVHDAARKVMDGISMRMVSGYDINNDEFSTRFDVYYGISMLDPTKSCRVYGK
jgi:hypothetical protein